MAKFLDLDGLKTFYGKVKSNFPQLVEDAAGNKTIPSTYLPSYVDDVLEGYLYNSKFYEDTAHTKEITAEGGKIYTDLSTNKIYRWSGTQYTVISDTIAIGTTAGTAFDGAVGTALKNAAFTSATVSNATITFKNTNGSQVGTVTVNNVANAASATKATQDSNGTTIASGYVYKFAGAFGPESITLSGHAPNGTSAITSVSIPVFTSASSTSGGRVGLVPAPAASADYAKQFLSADGTWKTVNIADAFVKASLEEDNYAAYRFEDMSGTTYEMPAISTEKGGIIKLGSVTLLTAAYAPGTDGTSGIIRPLQINSDYQGGVFLPYASSDTYGVVKAGTNITISNGVISSTDTKYSLPTATASVLGGVKVGSNLSITSDGVLSATAYTLPKATTSTLGGIIVGSGLSVDSTGKLSASTYSLPVATSTALGGIQIGYTQTNLNRAVQLSSNKAYVALQLASGTTEGVVKSNSTTTTGFSICPVVNGYVYYKDTNTTYSAATTSNLGLVTVDGDTVQATSGKLSINKITDAEIEALFE